MDYSNEEILRDYFRHLENPDDALLLDLVESVDEYASKSPLEAWPLVRSLIHCAPNDYALDYLAAGPLEGLLLAHGDLLAPIIAADAERDPKVRAALGFVLLGEPSESVRIALGSWLPHQSDT